MREIVKLAVSQAQKRSRLSEYTTFSRITTSRGDLDPFSGDLSHLPFSYLGDVLNLMQAHPFDGVTCWLKCRPVCWCIWPLWH